MSKWIAWLVNGSFCWHQWDKTLTHGMEFGTERHCATCHETEVLVADDSGWCGAYWGKISPAIFTRRGDRQ